jgi:acyl carrier protein
MKNAICEKDIILILAELLKIDPVLLKNDSHLIEDFHLESIKILSLIMMLESKYNITFNDEELSVEMFQTPKSLTRLVNEMKMTIGVE